MLGEISRTRTNIVYFKMVKRVGLNNYHDKMKTKKVITVRG